MAIWYPRARVRLVTLFDEQSDPVLPSTVLLGELEPSVVPAVGAGAPVALDPNAHNPLVHSFDINEWISVEVAENGYRIADTCRIQLDFTRMPFVDPRMIRSMGVLVYAGAVDPDRSAEPLPVDSKFLQFVGFLDDMELDFEEGATATLNCRDFTGRFIDTPQPKELDLRGNLETVLNRILTAKNAPWEGVRLEIRGMNELPELTEEVLRANQLPDVLQRQQKGPDGQDPKMAALGKDQGATPLSTWDVIWKLCTVFGVVPTITLSEGTSATVGPNTPRGVVLAVGPAPAIMTPNRPVRTMVYGRNLKDLKIKRKFGNLKVPQIIVKSYDPSTKKTIVGKFPQKDPEHPSDISPSGRQASNTPRTELFPGLKSEAAAVVAAYNIWYQMAHQELNGSLSTEAMASFVALPEQTPERYAELANADDTSLLKAHPGSPLRIIVAEDDVEAPGPRSASAYGELISLPKDEIEKRLVKDGYTPEVARLVARYLKGGVLQEIFRIKSLRKTFDHDNGFSWAAEFQNYVELHHDPNLQKEDKKFVQQKSKELAGSTAQGGKGKARSSSGQLGVSSKATMRHR